VQLVTASALPASGAVPTMNFGTMRHRDCARDRASAAIRRPVQHQAGLLARFGLRRLRSSLSRRYWRCHRRQMSATRSPLSAIGIAQWLLHREYNRHDSRELDLDVLGEHDLLAQD